MQSLFETSFACSIFCPCFTAPNSEFTVFKAKFLISNLFPIAVIFWKSDKSSFSTTDSDVNGESTLTKINNKKVVIPKDVQAIYTLDRNYNLIVIKTTKEEYINIMNEFAKSTDFETGFYFKKLIMAKLNKI